jgi:isoleucyl-tRNA synthetase
VIKLNLKSEILKIMEKESVINNKKQMEKSSHSEREERVLSFWDKNNTFKKSLDKNSPKGEFTFYDGPPFATGMPHYGHLLAGTIKDVIPRYKTMKGYSVSRTWGWDCHGLPVENLIEKELGLSTKKDIVSFGIDKFNQASKKSVMRYADEWRKIIPRMGRWVDMDNDYRTMDSSYTETIWWIFKSLYEKGLIYEGFKSMNMCPRCETTLSNFEVAQGYKDITDISVYVKFKIKSEILNLKSDTKNENVDVYLIAWTTTPWTLPGNVALAVNPDIEYVKIKIKSEILNPKSGDVDIKNQISNIKNESQNPENIDNSLYIVAESRLSVFKDKRYEIVAKIKGSELVGTEYEPVFDYYAKDSTLKNKENAWKVYGADFVTTEDGTGIVHIAPAFGADDYELLKKHNLPFVQHVSVDGHFKSEVTDFAGQAVKPKSTEEDKNAHQKADIEIIKWLAHHGNLFEKEKLVHSYPHCWRCDTPLLNYASSSWFVRVTQLKDKLVKVNKKIEWIPNEVGQGRFGNWLEGARDWAISRSRFWGAPIPVWRKIKNQKSNIKSEDSNDFVVIGSVDELKKYSRANNEYFVMRHGEAENNILGILSGKSDNPHHLTEKGKAQVKDSAQKLKSIGFDFVYSSPFVRTMETAKIVSNEIGLENLSLKTDERLRELGSGVWEGKSVEQFAKEFPFKDRFTHFPENGESYADIKKRMGDFLYEMEKKHKGKKILIITHETPALMLLSSALGLNRSDTFDKRRDGDYLANAEYRKIDFVPIPHNSEYEIDMHRPYIDEIELITDQGEKLVRVSDVFDCWFESGAMPYASRHYPFQNQISNIKDQKSKIFEPKSGWFRKSKGYPADFIAEGLDQTRGWFYSMLVLGVGLFGTSPFKRVIVNGLVLAEDGEKMSKSKKNYPDPMNLVEKYGADSIRFYMLSSPVVHAEDLFFSEKGVDEVTKKVVNRLLNVVTFYGTYSNQSNASNLRSFDSKNVLDRWIVSRLNQAIISVTKSLEDGELDKGTRPILDVIDDLSTWYLRRSRDRFKGGDSKDKENAINTTGYVLLEISKLIAPYMPFLAEEVYQKIMGYEFSSAEHSVHLESWSNAGRVDTSLLIDMELIKDISSRGLEARTNAKINVRQPLQTLRIKNKELGIKIEISKDESLIDLIKAEVNVKNVMLDVNIQNEVELDTNITPELREEGMVRELLRAIQDMRKQKGLTVHDKALLRVDTDSTLKNIIENNINEIKETCTLEDIEFSTLNSEMIKIGDIGAKIEIL